jgi:hypothetical protein
MLFQSTDEKINQQYKTQVHEDSMQFNVKITRVGYFMRRIAATSSRNRVSEKARDSRELREEVAKRSPMS